MTPEEREMLLEMPAVQELLREEREACATALLSLKTVGPDLLPDLDCPVNIGQLSPTEALQAGAVAIRARSNP